MPTIESIKPIIGINSPSIISSAIKEWKKDLSNQVRSEQGIDSNVPKILLDALTDLWEQAQAEAKTSIKDKVEDLKGRQAALNKLESDLIIEAERVNQLVNVIEDKYREKISHQITENTQLVADLAKANEQIEKFRVTVTEIEMKNAVLTETVRQEKEKYTQLESLYDREHTWSLKRIEEEKENHRKETEHNMERLQAESSRNKQTAELAYTKSEQLMLKINELERHLVEEKLKLAELTLDKARLQSEINKKDVRIRLYLAKNKKDSVLQSLTEG